MKNLKQDNNISDDKIKHKKIQELMDSEVMKSFFKQTREYLAIGTIDFDISDNKYIICVLLLDICSDIKKYLDKIDIVVRNTFEKNNIKTTILLEQGPWLSSKLC